MILSAETFLNSGLPTSDDISSHEVENAIRHIELYCIKPALTEEVYGEIVSNPDDYDDVIKGTATLAGLNTVISDYVFAFMLVNKARLTRYTSVIKDDEHSTEPTPHELMQQARMFWEMATTFLIEICEYMGIDTNRSRWNQLAMGELLR